MDERSGKMLTRREMLRLAAAATGITTFSSILAACGQPSASPAPTGAPAAPAATAAIIPEGEILIWDRPGDTFTVFDDAIPAFNKKYPKIKVNHQPVETSKLAPTLTAGVGVPDGAFIEDDNVGPIVPQLYDLTEWMKPHVKDIVPFKVRVNTHDGKILGIPWDLDPALLYYRADILDQHGIKVDDIKTYDDLIEAAKQLKAKDSKLKPIRIENNPGVINIWVAMFANQQGSSYLDANGNLQTDTEPFLNIMKFLKRVVDEGVGSRVELASPGDIAASDQGIQVFAPFAIWLNFFIGQMYKESKGKWRATRLPAWKAGGTRAASMGGSTFIIPAKAKNPQLAWLYYEFMMLSEEGIKASFGPNKIYPTGIDTVLPSYLPAYKTQLMGNPPQLGGQNLWELGVQVAQEIPDTFYFPTWYSQLPDIVGANVQRLYDGQLSPEDAVKRITDEIKSKLMRS